ncbi:uncharacterized protein LOC144141465 [Haemaphysalis longicornis]
MDTLEKLWQLVRQQELLGSDGAAGGSSAAPGTSSKAAKEAPHAERADRILALYDRFTELDEELTALEVQRRNIKNSLMTQQDENLHLQLALEKERRKVEHAWAVLEGGGSSRDVSPPQPPPASRRETHQAPQRFVRTTARNALPFLGDADWDAAGSSLMPLIQSYNMHSTNESDMSDRNNEDDNGPPPLRGRRNDGNSNVHSRMRRCNAVSSLLTLTGSGQPINTGALRPPQDQPNQPQRRPSIRYPYHHHHQPSNHGGPSSAVMEFLGQVLNGDEVDGQGAAHASTSAGGNNQDDIPSGSDRERTGSPEAMPSDYEQLPLD